MRLKVADVVDAVSQLVGQGYGREFRIKDGRLFDLARGSALDPEDVHVDTALRLVSGEDGVDASNIYAITDLKSKIKGLLIDAYDIFDEICDRGLADRLAESRRSETIEDNDVPTAMACARFTRGSSIAIPSGTFSASTIRTFRHVPSENHFRCLGSILPNRLMCGWSPAYSGTCG